MSVSYSSSSILVFTSFGRIVNLQKHKLNHTILYVNIFFKEAAFSQPQKMQLELLFIIYTDSAKSNILQYKTGEM
jgi:hypothetical protein